MGKMGAKGACAVKAVIRGVYIALIGLIVFTGALCIAQGLSMRGQEKHENPLRALTPQPEFDGPELTL